MNPLDDIIASYEITKQSHNTVKELLYSDPNQFIAYPKYSHLSIQEIADLLDKAQDELDDLTIVSLVSIFEQILLDDVNEAIKSIKSSMTGKSNSIHNSVIDYFQNRAERLNFRDLYEIYSPIVDPTIIANVK